ncbi:MAG: FAD-dependent oxidoreductase [Alphaproteobacteria bacterium]|nr:FAD-dependent oxidoreductase [Alphaproteobacteria bacterium]
MKVVIIGGGTAGLATAAKLRRLDENAEIVILEKSAEFAVSTCALPYYLSGQVTKRESFAGISAEDLKSRYNITIRLNSEVENIDRKEKCVKIANREDEFYDKLVIATGAIQLRPDIEGILSEKVFTIKSLASVDKIKNFIQYNKVRRAVVLGGGFIGVEMAESLCKLGIKVSIIEAGTHILPFLDADTAALAQQRLEEKGISVFINHAIMAFGEDDVRLNTGSRLKYDMALVATGVRPDVKLPVLAELEIGKAGGIVVTDQMQTNDKDIYAVGDTAEVTNLTTGQKELRYNAAVSLKEAAVAAAALSGGKVRFPPVAGTAVTPVFDLTAAAGGCNEAILQKAGIAYKKLHLWGVPFSSLAGNPSELLLKLLFSESGKIFGIQGIGKSGADKRIDVITEIIKKEGCIADLEEAEIAYAPAYAAASDAVNHLGSLAQSVADGKLKLIMPEELDLIRDQAMLIDIRQPAAFAEEHLDGAINLPLTALRRNLDSIPHDKTVIVYCLHGRGSYQAALLLKNRGFDNIYMLSGGMKLYNLMKDTYFDKKG